MSTIDLYLDEAKQLANKHDRKLEYDYKDLNPEILISQVLDMIPILFKDSYIQERQELRTKYAHSIPNIDAIKEICKYSPICEVGSGTGYWAKIIDEHGGQISCIETKEKCYYELEEKSIYYPSQFVDKISEYKEIPKDHSLLMIFPPSSSAGDGSEDMAYNYLKNYQGNTLLYVGENSYGSNGTEDFFDLVRKNYELTKEVAIPRFPEIYDQLWVFKRNKE